MLRLELIIEGLFFLQLAFEFLRMFQDEGQHPVDLRQRTDGRERAKDLFSRAPPPEGVRHHVESNSGPGHIPPAVSRYSLVGNIQASTQAEFIPNGASAGIYGVFLSSRCKTLVSSPSESCSQPRTY